MQIDLSQQHLAPREPAQHGDTLVKLACGYSFVLRPALIGVRNHASGGLTSYAGLSDWAVDTWLVVSTSGIVLGALEDGIESWIVRKGVEQPARYTSPIRLDGELRTAPTWTAALEASWWVPSRG